MKVLMTADALGGVWSYALSLAAGLQRSGVDVIIAVMGGRLGQDRREEAAARRGVTLVESDYRLEWMQEPWADVAAAGEWLLDLERLHSPDVIHLNGYALAAQPWMAPVLVVAHSCVCSWWRAVHGCDAPDQWQPYRTAVAAGLDAADAVVAPTRAMLDSLELHYGAPHRGGVIPNGCDPAPLPLGARDAFGRYARRRAEGAPIILAAGRIWDESKNMQALAAAAGSIHWPVYVAGSADHPEGGRRTLAGVHLLGALPPATLRQWQQRAAIFAHPAVYEPFGLAPLEAALAGSALVLGDIPSLREVWADAAVYVPPRDPAAIAQAVNHLATDPGLLARYAAAARARAGRFSVRAMTRSYQTLYTELRAQRIRDQETLSCAS